MHRSVKKLYKHNSFVIQDFLGLSKLIMYCIKHHYVIIVLRLLIPAKKGLYKIDKNFKSRYYNIMVISTSLLWQKNMLGYQNDKEYI